MKSSADNPSGAAATSIPMIRPRCASRITSTGKLFSTAPSTNTCLCDTTGGRMPGREIVARNASRSRPCVCTWKVPCVRSLHGLAASAFRSNDLGVFPRLLYWGARLTTVLPARLVDFFMVRTRVDVPVTRERMTP